MFWKESREAYVYGWMAYSLYIDQECYLQDNSIQNFKRYHKLGIHSLPYAIGIKVEKHLWKSNRTMLPIDIHSLNKRNKQT